jgi:hypothetical protein
MRDPLSILIFVSGFGQLSVLVASALVPLRLNWKEELRELPALHRQLFWIYGGYVVLAIVAFALLSLFQSGELASGSGLARGVCAYIAAFWGVRLILQRFLKAGPYTPSWWLKAGYQLLTLLFITFTCIFTMAAMRPPVM